MGAVHNERDRWWIDASHDWVAVYHLGSASIEGDVEEMRAWAEALESGAIGFAAKRCAVRWTGQTAHVSSPRNSITATTLDKATAARLGAETLAAIEEALALPKPEPLPDGDDEQ